MIVGLLSLLVLAYGSHRWATRNDAKNERRELAQWADQFSIPESSARQAASVVERSCPEGLPRRATRIERSTLPAEEVLIDLASQAEHLGWTSNQPGLAVVGAGGSSEVRRPALTLYKADREFEVWVTETESETEVRLVVATGVGGLGGCY